METTEISQYFTLDHEVVETTGFGNGLVIKFNTFYLKIYDDIRNSCHIIEGYLYDHSLPVKTWKVTYGKIKGFAESIKCDNFLSDHIDKSI